MDMPAENTANTEAPEKIPFVPPPHGENNEKLIKYLTEVRCISPDLVQALIDEGRLYQDTLGNVVFIGLNKSGHARAAFIRGTRTDVRYHGFWQGGDIWCGFALVCGNSRTVRVFECPIDILSYITLHPEIPWREENYLSLGNLSSRVLLRFLRKHEQIRRIIVCLDNDKDNYRGNWGERKSQLLIEEYGKKTKAHRKYVMERERPALKDWNDVLCMTVRNK